MNARARLFFGICLLALARTPAARSAEAAPTWSGDRLGRVEVLAVLQTLNAELLSHNSATLTLDRWCGVHHLATPARIVAERVHGVDKQPDAEQRQLLGVGATEPVRYRRVRLRCGDRILSEADNWYVPARLTADMNRALDSSDIAFGRAVQALHFQRHTLSAELLWSPLPSGWDMGATIPDDGKASLQVPHQVLQHRAILTLPDGTPFSEVVETYTEQVLGFPQPGSDHPARVARPRP